MFARTRTAVTLVAVTMAIVGLMATSAWAEVVLKVDFNSNQDSGGDSTAAGDPGLSAAAHNQEGWSSYHANHEVAAEFSTANYGGITVTPAWPNTTANTVQQSIDRSATNDNNWDNAAGDLNLVTDWIGTDTRTANGGNGNWNGTTGTPTYMTLTLGGLSGGSYAWTSYHHDTEHCFGPFAVWISTDGGVTFTQLDDGVMTDSTTGGTPDSGAVEVGPDANTLSSTYHTSFVADGANAVVLRFAPYADAAGVHRQIWGMNGFVIETIITPKASGPKPGNGATDVPRDTDLTWAAGESAQTHNVYLGTVLDDVTNATVTNPLGVLVSQGQTETVYAIPAVLELGQTYYWRVDEVATNGTITAGDVWTFTVEPVAYPIEGVIATSDLVPISGQGPENTVDGSGVSANDEHSTDNNAMWTANADPAGPEIIQFEFDRVYKMYDMRVWNHNLTFESFLGLGLKDVTIEYSADGVDWTVFGDVVLPQAPGQPTYTGSVVSLEGIPAKFIRFVINSTWLSTAQLGLSEVRFSYIPAHARSPYPADGATDVAPEAMLSWRAGREAVSHDVYLGTDPNALELHGVTTVNSYVPGDLVLATTYAWRVDEVNAADAVVSWPSDVWTFSTQEFLLIDSFETYNDSVDDGTTIWQTWVDGLDDTTNGNSQVGYDTSPFAEQATVRTGTQSMPLKYNNLTAPFYSETTRTFSPAQDWTQYGIKGLMFWFYGDPANTAAQMYVKINGRKVLFGGDTDSLLSKPWQPWYIDLAEVPGVDLTEVTQLKIGFEGGSGLVLIDDVVLVASPRQLVTPVEPDSAGLLAHYAFDGNAGDATVVGSPTYTAGQTGQAIQLNGVDQHLWVDRDFDLTTYSAALWFRVDGGSAERDVFSVYNDAGAHGILLEVRANSELRYLHRAPIGDVSADLYSGGVYDDGLWYHAAIVKSADTVTLYVNGIAVASAKNENTFDGTLNNLAMGVLKHDSLSRFLPGAIDEVYFYGRDLSAGEVGWLAGRTNPYDN